MAFKRSQRVSDEIMREVSGMIVRGEIKDPRVSGVFVTGVKITENLSMAEVFFTVLGGEDERAAALEGLKHARGFIRSRLAKKIRMRKIPDIKFSFDEALETGYKVDEILRGITREQ